MAPIRRLPRSKVLRGFVVLACMANVVLLERILTAGSFTDPSPIVTEPPALVAAGIALGLGAIVEAVLASTGGRAWRPAGLAWGLLSLGTGLAWLLNGDESGLVIAAIGALTVIVLLSALRARQGGAGDP
jgi:hypothetical protein